MSDRSSSRQPSAYDEAVSLLARKPLTQAEVSDRLAARGHEAPDVAAALERLRVHGYVDDERLALDYVVARAARLGHGPARLLADLERRGVDRDVAERAWSLALEAGDVRCEELIARRLRRNLGEQRGPLDRNRYVRVYNALLRAGFDSSMIENELETHRPLSEPTDD